MGIELTFHNDGSVTIVAGNEGKVIDPEDFLLDTPVPQMDGYSYEFRILNREAADWFNRKLLEND